MLNVLYFYGVCLVLINITYSLQLNETEVNELKELEKEKNDLLKQIHDGIDESVSLLKKENSTQNEEGIKYMLELKQQIEKPNESETENATAIEEDSDSILENRRKLLNPKFTAIIKRQLNLEGIKKDKDFDVNRFLFNKKFSKEKLKKIVESRLAMQKKLDEWILQREIEKAKIRNRYLTNKRLVQAGLLEKCPRFGHQSKVRRKTKRRYDDSKESEEKPKKIKRDKKKKTYPCCRKCCKKSYMGCL